MAEIKCKCGSESIFIESKGNQTGIYCSECGKWIKWATKEEIRLFNHKQVVVKPVVVPTNSVTFKDKKAKEDFVKAVNRLVMKLAPGENATNKEKQCLTDVYFAMKHLLEVTGLDFEYEVWKHQIVERSTEDMFDSFLY